MSVIEKKTAKLGFRGLFGWIWENLGPRRARFVWGCALVLLATGAEVIAPLVIGRIVDKVATPQTSFGIFYALCAGYLGLILAKALLEGFEAYFIQTAGQVVSHDLRASLFDKILSLPIGYFDENTSGRLLTRVINDVKSLSELFTASISVLALDVLVIIGTITAMFILDARIAAVTLLSFPLVIFAIHHFGVKLSEKYRNARLRLSEINSFLGENIAGIATIQRLSAEKERLRRFETIVRNHEKAQLESVHVFSCVQPIANLANGLSTGTLLAVGAYWINEGRITVGVLVAFLGYVRNLFQPIRDLVEKYNTFLSAQVSAERVEAVLVEKSEVMGSEAVIGALASEIKMGIRFERVSFTYPTRLEKTLSEVSFDVPAGKSLAIVGATGSGKSTIIRLLLRFYEPDSGKIFVNGNELAEWNRRVLRLTVALVPQETYIFHGTVADNLTLGQVDRDTAFLEQACRQVELWNSIKHRGGLEMPLLEGGTNLSVGERQLLNLGRVLVRDPKILVLDEATSNIDRASERKVLASIRNIMKGRTSLVIAHRLSTVREADAVLVLSEGKVKQHGTWQTLLAEDGELSNLWQIHERGSELVPSLSNRGSGQASG